MVMAKHRVDSDLSKIDTHTRSAHSKGMPARGPVSQQEFQSALSLERKRSERSGRPFLLMLVSADESPRSAGGLIIQTAIPVLASCIRETDIFGWYEQSGSLGLLMTELGEISDALVESIVKKISAALEKSVPLEAYSRMVVVVRVFPDEGEDRVFYPDLSHRNCRTKVDHIVKRAIDVFGSVAALILLLPVLLAVATAVKCSSSGPVFYWQTRVGRHGREFCFYKFRTMLANNDPRAHREYTARLIAGEVDGSRPGSVYKLANDPRVTPIGRLLRRTSLDELPQFFNVLLNDMSLVGPRPPLPYEYDRYRTWHRRRVLELKPGITGLWQVEGRSRTTFDEMVRMDIRYSKIRSTWTDLRIILRTPSAMFFGRGAC